jgi:apolipoprotein N-acyltransferase
MGMKLLIAKILLSCCSGLFLILVFPSFSWAILAWVALLPLFFALHRQGLPVSFGLGFITGAIGIMGIFYWITTPAGVQVMDFLMMVAYGGLYFGAFAVTLNFLVARTFLPLWVLAPPLWVTLEYIRSHFFFLEIPWALLGHSQYQHLQLIQVSEFTGVYGISFLIVMVNAALYEAFQSFGTAIRPAIISLGFVAVAWAYGWIVLEAASEVQQAYVTVIQGNIPQDIKWDPASQQQSLLRHIRLTEQALQSNSPSLIVWPETSAPGALRQDGQALGALSTLAQRTNTFLLVGTAERPKFLQKHLNNKNRFNSALLILGSMGMRP